MVRRRMLLVAQIMRDYAQSPHAVIDGHTLQPNGHNPRSQREIGTACGAGFVGGFALAMIKSEMSTATADAPALPTASSTLGRGISFARLRGVAIVVVLAAALTHTVHLAAYSFSQD